MSRKLYGMDTGRFQVWSCGGGTQSVAIAALIYTEQIPKPHTAIIADTGFEKQSTWEYLESVLVPKMNEVGVCIVRVKKTEWGNAWCQQGAMQSFASSGDLLIPAFTNITGNTSKLPAFCSKGWKQEVADRYLSKTIGLKPSERQKWLGFSLEEPKRYIRHLDSRDVWLPLVHGVPMRRSDCIRLVERLGWPTPPRSNCWMCPNQSDDEWREIMSHRPEEFAAAVEYERTIRETDPNAFLHKQCVPLSEVDFSQPQMEFSRACDSGECFV